MPSSRRFFLRNGAFALAGTTALPGFLVRSVLAQAQAVAPNRRLVVIFQRGAADGLNVVVPYREKNYYAMRPTIAIPQNQVLDLAARDLRLTKRVAGHFQPAGGSAYQPEVGARFRECNETGLRRPRG